VEVTDTRVIDQAEAWIQDHLARSQRMTSVEAGTWLHRWLLDPFGFLVARLADMASRVIASRRRRRASRNHAFTSHDPGPGPDGAPGGNRT
jgi:hypothetical protein